MTVYLPLAGFLFVLLFPFYWMAITTFKPNEELLSREGNPFWVRNPTLAHIKKLLFDTPYPDWLLNTMLVSVVATFAVAALQRARRLCDRAAALQGLALRRHEHLPRLPRAAVDPVHSARDDRLQAQPLRHAARADPHLPDVPDPVLHVAPDGLLQVDPLRARGMRADRRRVALADPDEDHPAARGAGPHLRGHLRVHAVLERVHLRADVRVLVGGEDGARRRRDRARRGRRLPLGLADGRARCWARCRWRSCTRSSSSTTSRG